MKRIILPFVLIFALQPVYAQEVTFSVNSGVNDPVLQAAIERSVSGLLNAVNRAFDQKGTPDLTGVSISEGAAMGFRMLWNNNPFHCDESDIVEPVIRTYDGGYQVRNIPLELMDEKGNPSYKEMVVDLDETGCITRVNKAIEANLYRKIMQSGSQVTDLRQRQIILNYVEDFRTSYEKKDIDFLEMVFSDDALIITGKVVQRKKGERAIQMKPEITYTKYSKQEYLNRLRTHVFPNTKTIDVTFGTVEVVKHPSIEGYFGVLVRQGYKSVFKSGAVYEDDGYLFMLWDFRDENRPQIHVRTWQPYWMNDARTESISEDQIININSFRITQ
ncbi:MAG: hypothetical protein K6G79_01635 [Bacteroidales bacterium]|nr:hypothetical protein [Bacteroidales bacterium]